MDVEVEIRSTSLEAVAERMGRRAAVRTYNVAVFAAEEMERQYRTIVSAEFFTDRPPHRSKGTLPLIDSAVGEVVGVRGELPVSARLVTAPGADTAKVAALEFGSSAHTISPSGKGLAFPRGRDKWTQAHGANNRFIKGPVDHPGNDAYGMMRRARGAAMEPTRRYALKIR